jgi:tagaturonate epimerase
MNKPVSLKFCNKTFGCGDRLGITTEAHINALKKYNIVPVLAQQSKRELDFTGRTWECVLGDAILAVDKTGFDGTWGADADHLKNIDDIKDALNAGFTFITLDLSEQKKENVISFIEEVYSITQNKADLEISIDETDTPTTLEEHYALAKVLKEKGIKVYSIAPKFVGGFQKAIDYIGDLKEFEKNFNEHIKIADEFDYKISVHSGSDKFSIYPIIAKAKKFHIKTSGTSWLNAVETINETNKGLYFKIFECACDNFESAKKYYKVKTENYYNIISLRNFNDEALRQVIHITYGYILRELKYYIIEELNKHQDLFYSKVQDNIEKHLNALSIETP